uniref:ATPase subunit 8 n=1 Tax=Bathygadus antrodes TaxID=332421 RepID=Q17UA6_9TELE|nr:ATP synthase F0 subunit 8 [Bathygadus favosus]YP_659529.1 ATP synthase F0 subunit 8 [Bathygadus antrodes]WMI35174.1 ATP synthase F0 subunit 8 [Bathygadus favosus]BAE96362.1 ATPase subunit 8 [Bathygadus antrodes]
MKMTKRDRYYYFLLMVFLLLLYIPLFFLCWVFPNQMTAYYAKQKPQGWSFPWH